MEKLIIEGTEETPEIIFSKEDGTFQIRGYSLPEDVRTFYRPLIIWLKEYAKEPIQKTVVSFELLYYNTSSSKMFLDVLNILKDIHRGGHNVEINWHYREEDEDMIEAGEDYSTTTRLPFTFIQQ